MNTSWFLVAAAVIATATPAAAASHRCTDAQGRVTYSQTPCPDDRGPTPEQVAAAEEAARRARIDAENKRNAQRADQQLSDRYPDEAALRKGFTVEITAVSDRIRVTTKRLEVLVAERRPIDEQTKFYEKKTLPADLQRKLEKSESQFAAVAQRFRELEADVADIVAKYGRWRERLRQLWAGAKPGSMGLLDTPPPPR